MGGVLFKVGVLGSISQLFVPNWQFNPEFSSKFLAIEFISAPGTFSI
jgi:hypothetical protein